MLWIRVRWDPELFDQVGSGSVIIVPDPDLTIWQDNLYNPQMVVFDDINISLENL